jgi:CheY-like chemotaxis protein
MRAARTVLVVDDDSEITAGLQKVLEDYGFIAIAAANGRDALAYLRREEPPCLVLLDLYMPVMSGAEFRAEQLKDERLAAIPVAILTGDSWVELRARELNVDRYLKKPVQIDQLLGLVERYCTC